MIFGRRKAKADGPRLTREAALAARPEQLPVVDREELENGEVKMTVELESGKWQTWMGGKRTSRHQFILDAYGLEVYEACDGKTKVSAIIRRFAQKHAISQAEAQRSVTQFLKTLMAKGLIAMAIDKGKK